MFKNQKGITLIALVITIIVLLILAGITIALITNNDSAPNKAAEAKVIQDVGAAKDAIAINAAELMTDYYDAKYVSNSIAGTSTPQSYIKANTKTVTSGLFKTLNNVTIVASPDSSTGLPANTFVVRSNATVSHTVSNTATSEYYWVQGTIEQGGTITWSDGQWGATQPSFSS